MSGKGTKYSDLPFLDSIHQPTGSCGEVTALKIPLRKAINTCRTSDRNMEELITLLQTSLDHIQQKKPRKKKTVVKKEYDLP